jgi:hypothetical protein
MEAFRIACPACNLPMSVKRSTSATGRLLHVVGVCVVCNVERTQYLNVAGVPAPANDTEPKHR